MGNRKKLDVNSNNYATSLTAFRDYLNNLSLKPDSSLTYCSPLKAIIKQSGIPPLVSALGISLNK